MGGEGGGGVRDEAMVPGLTHTLVNSVGRGGEWGSEDASMAPGILPALQKWGSGRAARKLCWWLPLPGAPGGE